VALGGGPWFIDTVARVLVDGEETNGNYSVVDSVGPQGNMPPLHVHQREDEVFHVVEGQLTVFLPGEAVELNAGDTLRAPCGVPHTYRVESETCRWLVFCQPAGFEEFVRAVSEPHRRRSSRPRTAPTTWTRSPPLPRLRGSSSSALPERSPSETMPGVEITRIGIPTNPGPGDWFTGAVYLDPVAAPAGRSRLSATAVHFTPGARTAWHTHPNGQTIYVLEGVGLCQTRGAEIEVMRPGDRVFFEPGEEHWHGAAATRLMTHIAMLQVDEDGNNATWLEHVTDEEYGAAPAID
jgi:quercetin dioxygenase-like cupin family protein